MVGVHQPLIAALAHRAVAGERIGDRPADDREGQPHAFIGRDPTAPAALRALGLIADFIRHQTG